MALILKHEIPAASEFTLPLHEGSTLLKLDVVNEKAYIWAMEDKSKPQTEVKFKMAMTGVNLNIEPSFVYLGTFILCNGSFVGHLFVETHAPMLLSLGI